MMKEEADPFAFHSLPMKPSSKSGKREIPQPSSSPSRSGSRSRSRSESPEPTCGPQLVGGAPLVPGIRCTEIYKVKRGSSDVTHKHYVWWQNGSFTMDGKNWRKIDENPENQSFWESVTHSKVPDEFNEEGMHQMNIRYMTPDQVWRPVGNGGKPLKSYPIMDDDWC